MVLGWDLKFCISIKLHSNTDGADLCSTLFSSKNTYAFKKKKTQNLMTANIYFFKEIY